MAKNKKSNSLNSKFTIALIPALAIIIAAYINKTSKDDTTPITNSVTVSPVINNSNINEPTKIEADTIRDTIIIKEKSNPINRDEERFYEMFNTFLEKYSDIDLTIAPQYDSTRFEEYNKANKYFEAVRAQAKKAGVYKDYKSFFFRFGQRGTAFYSAEQIDSIKNAAIDILVAKNPLTH